MDLGQTPKEIRQAIRQGRYTGGTAGLAPGYVQANLVVLPRAQAYDFLVFCQRNPRPCPLIEVTDPGSAEPAALPGHSRSSSSARCPHVHLSLRSRWRPITPALPGSAASFG